MKIYSSNRFYNDLQSLQYLTDCQRASKFNSIRQSIGAEYTKAQFWSDLSEVIKWECPDRLAKLSQIGDRLDRNQFRNAVVDMTEMHHSDIQKHPFDFKIIHWNLDGELTDHDVRPLFRDDIDRVFCRVGGYRSISAVLSGTVFGAYAFCGLGSAILTTAASSYLHNNRKTYRSFEDFIPAMAGAAAGALTISGFIPALITGAAAGLTYKACKMYRALGSPPDIQNSEPKNTTWRSSIPAALVGTALGAYTFCSLGAAVLTTAAASHLFKNHKTYQTLEDLPPVLAGAAIGVMKFPGFIPALLTGVALGVLHEGYKICKSYIPIAPPENNNGLRKRIRRIN